jgi:hypothetical protein
MLFQDGPQGDCKLVAFSRPEIWQLEGRWAHGHEDFGAVCERSQMFRRDSTLWMRANSKFNAITERREGQACRQIGCKRSNDFWRGGLETGRESRHMN